MCDKTNKVVDKLQEYRKNNPNQLDLFHFLDDVIKKDNMVNKGKLRLTPKNEYYELYAGVWMNILDIDKSGSMICSIDKNTSQHIILVEDNYELYEHYIKKFRAEPIAKEYVPVYQDEFETYVENRIASIYDSLTIKGKEYASNGREDKMHNFITAAKMNKTTPEKALHGMLTKHIISYQDILDDLDKGILPSEDAIKEKYGDIINYFILSEILLLKRIK